MIASQIPAKLVAAAPPSERQNKGELMKRILLLGLDPETVDFSDPALPPGMTAEKVHAGIAVALKQFTDRGWESDVGLILPDETAGPTVERQLRSTNYDCVVIGGGVRLPPRNLALFEIVINAIRKAAPNKASSRPHEGHEVADNRCHKVSENAIFLVSEAQRQHGWFACLKTLPIYEAERLGRGSLHVPYSRYRSKTEDNSDALLGHRRCDPATDLHRREVL